MPLTVQHARAGGVALAAAALAAVVAWDLTRGAPGSDLLRDAAAWSLTVVGCVALSRRRRYPVAVASVVLVCTAAFFPLSTWDLPVLLVAYAVALYTVAAEGRLAAAVTLAVVTMAGVVVGELARPGAQRNVDDTSVFLLTGWFVGVIAVGQAQRTRQAYLREAEQRALAAERERDVRARQSATEERLRIARELHDVLGHHISLIHVQAGAAVHRRAKRGGDEETGAVLQTIRDTSREALRELRATLGVLRSVDEDGGPAPTAPADAGVERLGELLEGARAAGLAVRSTVEAGGPLPPQVSLAAYRIVQESLTNVVKHAGARGVLVEVRREGGEVRVRVADDGRGTPAGADGSGLGGMAERARALGGELTAGPAGPAGPSGDGWEVRARLPLDGTHGGDL